MTFADVPADSQVQRAFQTHAKNTFNVSVSYEGGDGATLLKGQEVKRDPKTGDIFLAPLVDSIRDQGFDLTGCMVLYWSEAEKVYVFAGVFPAIKLNQKISMAELNAQNVIQIKLRPQAAVAGRTAKRTIQEQNSLDDSQPPIQQSSVAPQTQR